jgi:hypothetical protein
MFFYSTFLVKYANKLGRATAKLNKTLVMLGFVIQTDTLQKKLFFLIAVGF